MARRNDPITRAIKAMSADVPDIPQDALFDMETKQGDDVGKKVRRPKTIRSMNCPECTATGLGVIRIYDRELGQHVELLKKHDRITRKGHRFSCPASNRRVDND